MREDEKNVKNISEKQENIRLNSASSKKITSLQIIYVTGYFEWLKTCELKTRFEQKTIKNY